MPAPGSTADIHLLQRSSDYRQVLPPELRHPSRLHREQERCPHDLKPEPTQPVQGC